MHELAGAGSQLALALQQGLDALLQCEEPHVDVDGLVQPAARLVVLLPRATAHFFSALESHKALDLVRRLRLRQLLTTPEVDEEETIDDLLAGGGVTIALGRRERMGAAPLTQREYEERVSTRGALVHRGGCTPLASVPLCDHLHRPLERLERHVDTAVEDPSVCMEGVVDGANLPRLGGRARADRGAPSEQIRHLCSIDLHVRDREARREAKKPSVADRVEQLVATPRHEPEIRPTVAKHGVRLAAARLPVHEDTPRLPVQEVAYGSAPAPLVHFLLPAPRLKDSSKLKRA